MPTLQIRAGVNRLALSPSAMLQKFESLRIFSEREAWTLFRLAAIGEAVGWSLLIAGILCQRFVTPHSHAPVLIAGQVHGMLFLGYAVATIALYASLGWSRKQTIAAALAGVPPYGSLLFERWAAHRRGHELARHYRKLAVYVIIPAGDRILLAQPKDSRFWQLPGGAVQAGETAEQALERQVLEQTGIRLQAGSLAYVHESREGEIEQLALLFRVANPKAFTEDAIRRAAKTSLTLDGLRFAEPSTQPDLRPAFLRAEPIADVARDASRPVILLQPSDY